MITIGDEKYVLATEAAQHLGVSRVTFYKQYKQALKICRIGKLRRAHYRVTDLDALNQVQVIEPAAMSA